MSLDDARTEPNNFDFKYLNVTSDDSVLGRGFISYYPKISCQFATKIKIIQLKTMFTDLIEVSCLAS